MAIAKAETKAVPAQSSNIYVSALAEVNSQFSTGVRSGNASSASSTFSSQLSSITTIYSQGLQANLSSSGNNNGDTELGEKINATVVSGSS